MSDPERSCDLCALPVGGKPFLLPTHGRILAFCCEGCRGIYQLLYQINEAPVAPSQNEPPKT